MARKYHRLHTQTAESETVQLLIKRPRTPDELSVNSFGTGPIRDMVCRLIAPGNDSGASKYRAGTKETVYYLYGDDRRAVRRFIEVNEEFVASCLDDSSNPLSSQWDDILYQMLLEEWDIRAADRRREEGDDGE